MNYLVLLCCPFEIDLLTSHHFLPPHCADCSEKPPRRCPCTEICFALHLGSRNEDCQRGGEEVIRELACWECETHERHPPPAAQWLVVSDKVFVGSQKLSCMCLYWVMGIPYLQDGRCFLAYLFVSAAHGPSGLKLKFRAFCRVMRRTLSGFLDAWLWFLAW